MRTAAASSPASCARAHCSRPRRVGQCLHPESSATSGRSAKILHTAAATFSTAPPSCSRAGSTVPATRRSTASGRRHGTAVRELPPHSAPYVKREAIARLMADLKLFFATDIHGSDLCWKKFINAAKFFGCQVLVMGGDMTGKMLVPIVDLGDGRFSTV